MSKRKNRNRQAAQSTSAADVAAEAADDSAELNLESALERPDATPENNPRNSAIENIADKVNAAFDADNAASKDIPYEDEDGNIISAPAATEDADGEEGQSGADDSDDTNEIDDAVVRGASRTDDGLIVDDKGEAIDPEADYEIESDGVVKKVKGKQIIEAGRRTLQKNDAADLRLDLANQLLEEAKRRAGGPSPKGGDADSRGSVDGATGDKPTNEDEDKELIELADKIQYGTKEQAVEALKKLRASQPTVTPDQVLGFVASRLGPMMARQKEFFDAVDFAKSEYSDLLEIPAVRTLFFHEENRRRAPKDRGGEGDRRAWKDLYTAIGEDLRKQLRMPKPSAANSGNGKGGETFESRRLAKQSGPRVPNPAGGRVEGDAPPKEPTRKDILNEMRATRHQPIQ